MSEDPRCEHWFQRIGWTRRWVCEKCGFTTRRYDSVDARMTRPFHPHMTVAAPGYNAGKKPTP